MTIAEPASAVAAQKAPVRTRALIIGTGFSGLGMAIALQKQGVDFVIVEKADDIGGTWRDNTYPGCACDIPSHMYSFSFEPKADWTHMWSLQPEILDYLRGVTDKYGLRRYVHFNAHVQRAHWDDAEMRWHVFTDSGQEYVAQFL
ncbi:MAG: NAD(P)/FAD-dependent oxidoreductase, partial [Actinomycetota bacterium]|nr:NAD(P)/FAD-dependent oxidoreductase [Actinomycetota bacterium]